MSAGNFNDDSPDHLARAMVMATARRLYSHLPEARLVDPVFRELGGKRVYGSVYPDVKNEPFFKAVERSLRLTKKLPKGLRRSIEIIDEIRYNPPSRHYVKSGTLDVSSAYYHKGLSGPGRRTVFVRRDMLWSSDVDLFLSLVHEGTHAVQDETAETYKARNKTKKAELASLTAKGAGGTKSAKQLKSRIAREASYVDRWYNGKRVKGGRRIQDIAFECEAVSAEIKGARAIDAPPSAVEDTQYLRVCDDAKVLLVRWKDARITGRAKR